MSAGLCSHAVFSNEIARLGLQSTPWTCEGGRRTAPLKLRDAKSLCDALEAHRIDAYAMADFDDSTIAWVFVFTPEESQ